MTPGEEDALRAQQLFDAGIAQARHLEVRPDDLSRTIAQLERRALLTPPTERFAWRWLLGGAALGATATAAVLLTVVTPAAERPGAPTPAVVQLHPRVFVAPEAGAVWRLLPGADTHTHLALERGAVTVRLHNDGGHAVSVSSGDSEFWAVGTMYSVSAEANGPRLWVHAGVVEVRRADSRVRVAAGHGWPDDAPSNAVQATGAAALRDTHPGPTARVADDSPPSVQPRAATAAQPAPSADATPIAERWRQARLLRAQNQVDAALAMLADLSVSGDPTWAPLALVEQMRIYDGVRPAPQRVVDLGAVFLAHYPQHALTTSVRDLICAAHERLGDGARPDCR